MNNILNKLKPISIKHIGKITIVTTSDKKYALKKQNRKSDFYDYLLTRSFTNFPKIYSKTDDEYELMDYIEDQEIPIEQKLEDIAYISSILHLKTTFDKDVDLDYLKEIYENLINKQSHLLKYYQELQDIIEEEIYMSPSNYLLIRNISKIYVLLSKSREYLDKWYDIVKNSKNIRYSFIHGNLSDKHILENGNIYLISWDKARIDLPVYEIDTLYKNNYMNINIKEYLSIYESKFPLKKEEKYLLLSLLLIPNKIDFTLQELSKIKQVSSLVMYVDKVLRQLEGYSEKTNENTNK